MVRDLPGAADYLGTAGALYRTTDEAVTLIHRTLSWSPAEWQAQHARTAHERQRFTSERVLRPLWEDWLSLAPATRLPATKGDVDVVAG